MRKQRDWSTGGDAHAGGESAAAGKRTLTEGMVQRKAAPQPAVAPVQLKPSDEPKGAQPDPFDFSYAEEKAALPDETPEFDTGPKEHKTDFGKFVATVYHPLHALKMPVGCEIVLRFEPNNKVNATQIAMVQIVRTVNEGKVRDNASETEERREISKDEADKFDSPVLGTDEGFAIDQDLHQENPLYAVSGAPKRGKRGLTSGKTSDPVRKATNKEKKKLKDKTGITDGTHAGLGGHGFHFKKGGEWKSQAATLHDAPRLQTAGDNAEQLFETTALAISGKQEGKYYGSVQWGWRTDGDGKFSLIPLTLISKGDPSATFVKAAEKWNRGETDDRPNIDLPIPGADPDDWQP